MSQYRAIDDDEVEGTEVLKVEWAAQPLRVVSALFTLTIIDNDSKSVTSVVFMV